ncbi:thiamine phosphate synthase [Candidatus Albibeggiatoa sp. nov. NOAA]|uniref:thiamine phosphate synthase n=1 Tax=Candidatus Albibeggiatoa sp. nov. NOAA TaxID=3162724 RepID=UPI0033041D15|nr:thiamine phosphate synthase [Thiotrichaceae bacterium]
MTLPIQGLYVITDSQLINENNFIQIVEAALLGGAKVVQYREKSDDQQKKLTQATALKALCHQYTVPLIINDDVDLAQQVQADGVHLGKQDADLSKARAQLSAQAIIGISCYNQLNLAKQAIDNGADYVAFGRFFPSKTKPNAVPASVDLLRQARQQLTCPIVAIGGITPENGRQLLQSGADSLAVINGVFAESSPQAVQTAAHRYFQLTL